MPHANVVDAEFAELLHGSLRAATRSEHTKIDRMIVRLDLSRRDDYGLFLNIHYAALCAVQSDARHEDRHDFRKMEQCLQSDLHILGGEPENLRIAARPPFTKRQRLGAAYVIRGSRLGAVILRRRVPLMFAASFLEFVPQLSWGAFLRELGQPSQLPAGDPSDEVISGARITFSIYSDLLTQALGARA